MKKGFLLSVLIFVFRLTYLPAQFFQVDFLPVTGEADFLPKHESETRYISSHKIHSCSEYRITSSADSSRIDSILEKINGYNDRGEICYIKEFDSEYATVDIRTYIHDSITGKITGFTSTEQHLATNPATNYNIDETVKNDVSENIKYDSSGNIVEFVYYFPPKRMKERYLFEYDKQHRCIRETLYTPGEYGSVRVGTFT
ncbi:MAG TPA: hypothetical protein VFJ43_05785, partial [Bacteroidia bacterium]|nr:hypothetical protein [Bacteroidia bacterium]